jgi:hypothetical protein
MEWGVWIFARGADDGGGFLYLERARGEAISFRYNRGPGGVL